MFDIDACKVCLYDLSNDSSISLNNEYTFSWLDYNDSLDTKMEKILKDVLIQQKPGRGIVITRKKRKFILYIAIVTVIFSMMHLTSLSRFLMRLNAGFTVSRRE